jgi:RNA polymerase sigma-70 factor (ECF subfamily)
MSNPLLGADEFTDAFARHGRTLWVIASAWVGRADAADLVQEAARVAWERRQQFAVGSDVRAWLAQITRHLGANWRRRNRRELPTSVAVHSLVAPQPAVPLWPFDAERHGLSEELARGLASLPEIARACLLLQVVMGHTFAEIAVILDIPENTASSHARRARLALREAMTTYVPVEAEARKTP